MTVISREFLKHYAPLKFLEKMSDFLYDLSDGKEK